jgi:hypothetical protein
VQEYRHQESLEKAPPRVCPVEEPSHDHTCPTNVR